MRGVILAGGTGSRLRPLTKVTNKHLLPIFDKPMIFYPLETLINADIKKILVVTGTENAGDFLKLLGSGKEYGVELTYRMQDGSGGIAQAMSLAEDFVGKDKCVVILGDNVVEDNIKDAVEEFENSDQSEAVIFLKEVEDPERFGVAELDRKCVVSIEEKPKLPKSNLAVIGVYMYDSSVFHIIKNLKPSARGEYEITDVNNEYIKRGSLGWKMVKGFWSDAGTFESLHRATNLVKEKKNA